MYSPIHLHVFRISDFSLGSDFRSFSFFHASYVLGHLFVSFSILLLSSMLGMLEGFVPVRSPSLGLAVRG